MHENGQNLESGSDISTEHSSDSEVLIEESVEDITISQVTVSDTIIDTSIEVGNQNNVLIAAEIDACNSSVSKSSNVNASEISLDEISNGVLSLIPVEITPDNTNNQLTVELNIQKFIEKPSEEYLNEISSTTFRFNVEQMKHGDKSRYYKETIILNSDDSNESDGSDSEDDNDKTSRYTYSSKLDDFILSNPKPKKPEIKEILINLDDYEDDEDIILVDPPVALNQKINDSYKLNGNL